MKKCLGIFVLAMLILLASSAYAQNLWVDTYGSRLVLEEGSPFTIRSIALAGEDISSALSLPLDNIFSDIAYLGFNTVSLGVKYDLLERDDAPYTYLDGGFACLDALINKASERGVYVIINMDTPQGGFQSWGAGNTLWQVEDNQSRLTAMWRAIASRYADNPAVLGYSLLNEPCPIADDMPGAVEAWGKLARRMVKAIREVDSRHIIFVESCSNYNDSSFKTVHISDEEMYTLNCGFPSIADKRVVSQFQQFEPYSFTHQSWSNAEDTPYLVYPSDFISYINDPDDSIINTANNEAFDIGTPYWDDIKSEMYRVDNPKIQYVSPAVSLWDMGEYGSVWIDEMYLNEYDENGKFVRTALYLSFNSATDFSLYADGGDLLYVSTGGKDGQGGTLYISKVYSGYALLENARVPVKQGYSYQLCFTIGGSDLNYSSSISPMLSFFMGGSPVKMNKECLANKLKPFLDYRTNTGTPLYVGGFGTNLASFSHGGLNWVDDALSMYEENGLNYNYFIYRNDYFGLYWVDGNSNQPLYDFFVERLGPYRISN